MSKRVSLILGDSDEAMIGPYLDEGSPAFEVLRDWAHCCGREPKPSRIAFLMSGTPSWPRSSTPNRPPSNDSRRVTATPAGPRVDDEPRGAQGGVRSGAPIELDFDQFLLLCRNSEIGQLADTSKRATEISSIRRDFGTFRDHWSVRRVPQRGHQRAGTPSRAAIASSLSR